MSDTRPRVAAGGGGLGVVAMVAVAVVVVVVAVVVVVPPGLAGAAGRPRPSSAPNVTQSPAIARRAAARVMRPEQT
ncbi:MAG: hypothetical protein ACRD0J_06270, partial [Acidimicrobiales bacterium]